MAQSDGYLSDHKLSLIFLKPTIFDQVSEKFTTLYEIHDEKNSMLVLEYIIHTDYEWMGNGVQNFFLQFQ